MSLRIRRGTDAQRATVNFDLGEIVWTTDTEKLYVGNGVTQGGVNIAKNLGGTGLQFNPTSGRLDLNLSGISTDAIPEGGNNRYFSASLTQGVVGSMFDNSAGNVVFAYNNVSKKITGNVVLDGGLLAIVSDTSPTLGGNLTLNGKNIVGSGNVNITGNITATKFFGPIDGNVNATTANMNTLTAASGTVSGILGVGTINATLVGNFPTVNADVANIDQLGQDLDLNNKEIYGAGSINLTGNIACSTLQVNKNLNGNSGIIVETNIQNTDTLTIKTYHSVVDPSTAFFYRAKGTKASPLPLADGDEIFALAFTGRSLDGTTSVSSAVSGSVSGAPGNAKLPGKLNFYTTGTDGSFGLRFTIGNDGKQEINAPTLTVGTNPGEVDINTITTWMKVKFNGVDYAVPMYRIRT